MDATRFSGRLALLASMVVLAACATNSEGDFRLGDPCTQGFIDEVRLAKELAAASPCCRSFAEMPFEEARMHYVIAISKASPVHEFPTGRSRFIALDLKQFTDDKAILIPMSSTALTAPANYTCTSGVDLVRSRAVNPVVQWLDADKRQVGGAARGRPAVARGAAGWEFDRPAGSRFMVIYSVPDEYGNLLDLPAPRAGVFGATETVGLGGIFHPQRTLGPAKFTSSGTGFFESIVR